MKQGASLKILMTNYHMRDWAGSEMVSLELATALKYRGHDVTVFTLFPGQVTNELEMIGIKTVTSRELASHHPDEWDVVHCHH